jgi:heat shock protein HslJ
MIKRLPLSPYLFLLPALLGLLLLALSSCGSDEALEVGGDEASTVDGAWELDSLSVDGAEMTVLADLEVSIEGGNIGGNTGCNSFGGALETDTSGGATIVDLFMTERACVEPERMEFEGTYAKALGEVDSWVRGPAVLTLAGPTATLIYVVADPPVNLPLEQTPWVLDTIFSGSGADGAASSTDQQANAASMMIANGRVSFSAEGCPDLQLDVMHEGSEAGTFDVMADGADLAPCGDVNWDALVNGAVRANRFEIDENRLALFADTDLLIGLRAG